MANSILSLVLALHFIMKSTQAEGEPASTQTLYEAKETSQSLPVSSFQPQSHGEAEELDVKKNIVM